jgi:hypothetical protein
MAKKMKRSGRVRIGLQEALERKGIAPEANAASTKSEG